jgi:hypothetical protein
MTRTIAVVIALVAALVLALVTLGLWLSSAPGSAGSIAGDAQAITPPGGPEADLSGRASGELQHDAASSAARAQVESGEAPSAPAGAATRGTLLVHARLEGGDALADLPLVIGRSRSVQPMTETRHVRTDAEGLARAEGLWPGGVSVWSPLGGRARAEVIAGEVVEVELVLKNVVDVAGTAVDAEGQPVAGAQVWVVSWRTDWLGTQLAARCGEDGRFALRNVSTRLSLGASAAGLAPSALVDLELVDTSSSPVELVLELGAEGADLSGRVVSSGGGPLAGALVAVGESPDYEMRADGTQAESWTARTAVTDATGRYRLDGLPAGVQPVHVWAAGHARLETEVELEPGAAHVLELELPRGVTVAGVVRDEAGAPVAGATILALDAPFVDPFPTQGPTDRGAPFHRPAARSGPDGAYRLSDVPPGTIHLHASKGTSHWDDGDYRGTQQATFEDVMSAGVEWNPVLSRGRRIHGRVTYADGTPLGNVFVSATDPETQQRYTVPAHTEGRFEIPALEHRPYTVSVQLWDPPDDARPLLLEDVWPSDDEVVLAASYSKVVEEQAVLRARIVDSAGRLEGRGAIVFAFERGWRHADERDGVWSTEAPPERYQARVMSGDELAGASAWAQVAPGEVFDFGEVHTLPACDLTVRVRRPAGLEENAVYAAVHADHAAQQGSRPIDAETDELVFEDLLQAPVTVEVSGIGVGLQRRELALVAGAANEVLFDLVPAARRDLKIDCPPGKRQGFGVLSVTYRRANGSLYDEVQWYERWGVTLPLNTSPCLPLGHYSVEATTTSGLRATGALLVESLGDAPGTTLTLE